MMKSRIVLTMMATACCLASVTPQIKAQNSNSILLFSPVNVRQSPSNATYDNPYYFNSNTLNLTCPASPTAVISSTTDGSGFVLVDNNINVIVTPSGGSPTTTNVCTAGEFDVLPNCFTTNYQTPASEGNLNGVNPDTLLSAAGGAIPAINIGTGGSNLLAEGSQTVTIQLEDEGGWLTSSTLYLDTNCTSGGVSAPATISGNPISSNNPPPSQLTQDFTFNPLAQNGITFEYDLSTAQTAGTLAIAAGGVTPSVGDSAIDPATFQTTWVNKTSFATSACLIHNGEIVSPGVAGCKLFTLTCTIGTGSDASGVNCPSSTSPNEYLRDIFDGPSFTLDDIPTTINGVPVTFHEGMGFLMASEPWTGGSCQFATGSGFESSICPQNLLSTFTGPGVFNDSASTTHPNSTFITIAKVPEDLTTITVAGMQPGNWVRTSTPTVTLSSQPPNLSQTNLPNVANFVPSPIQSITYGISAADSVPTPGSVITPPDTVLTNTIACPAPLNPTDPPATVFTPPAQTLSELADGQYLLHYFAKDCAGTEELSFTQQSGSWTTNFYTFPINVDTTPPSVATGPTLSPAPPYYQGQPGVTATFSCTDALSGVVLCGGQSFPAGTTNTGPVVVPVSTATLGSNTFSVSATDAAGNQSATINVPYTVNSSPYDGQIVLTLSPTTVTYPLGTNLQVTVSKINTHTPTGQVQILNNGTKVTTLGLNGGGSAFFYLAGLSAGNHSITAVYSGDKYNPGGTSAPVTLNVLSVPVTLSPACWNTPYPYGANFQCNVTLSSNAGAPLGVITYSYDGSSPVTLPIAGGHASIVISLPPVGSHNLVINYAAQTNYAASGPKTVNFVVTPAPVLIQLTPSTFYLTGGTLTLTASVKSSAAGPPNATGTVTFTRGATVLGSLPVNAAGVAAITVPASSLPNGSDAITASYSGGTNYGSGSTSITIQVAH